MSDLLAVHLNRYWAILFDRNQWNIVEARLRRDQSHWHPRWFSGLNKTTLRRVTAENGILMRRSTFGHRRSLAEPFLVGAHASEVRHDR
jgi:hypothetical protein